MNFKQTRQHAHAHKMWLGQQRKAWRQAGYSLVRWLNRPRILSSYISKQKALQGNPVIEPLNYRN